MLLEKQFIMAVLRRTTDGAGDEGSMMLAIGYNSKTGYPEQIPTKKPIIGYKLMVGSVTARTYSDQDWWLTSFVTEIFEEKPDGNRMYYRFKTNNSEYELWA